jgi:catechol 2,3-dioxygenase-like lactoylglutathione lyase family enzyme
MAMTPARNAIDVGLLVGDIAASLAFYEGVLGLRKVQQMPTSFGTMHRMAFGDSFVKLIDPAVPPPPGAPGLHGALGLRYLTFPVTDIDAVCEACRRAGVRFDVEKTEFMPGVTIAMVRDPDGNVVEFVQRR